MAGKKETEGKLPMHLLSGPALARVAEVLQFGMQKYDARNWEAGIPYDKLFQALQRHVWKWWSGNTKDAESGLSHMAHVACLSMFLLHFESCPHQYSAHDNRPIGHKEGFANGDGQNAFNHVIPPFQEMLGKSMDIDTDVFNQAKGPNLSQGKTDE